MEINIPPCSLVGGFQGLEDQPASVFRNNSPQNTLIQPHKGKWQKT
jgi:hypothetical protein